MRQVVLFANMFIFMQISDCMKKFLTLFVFFFCVIPHFFEVYAQQRKESASKADSSILICYSESTSYYHRSASCPSISKCNNLQKVSLEDAINKYHRTACKKCAQLQSVQAH